MIILIYLNFRHTNIVYIVKSCYKIKINYRESKSCFYGILLSNDLIQICFTRF